MTRIFSLFVVFMLSGVLAFSQNRVVTGTVIDEKGVAVTGASISVLGGKVGAFTDENGKFKISNVPAGAKLQVTGVSIASKEVTLGVNSNVSVSVVRTATELANVVVVGALGNRKSARTSGTSSAAVTNAQFTVGKPTNIAQALSGKVSGLAITNNSSSVNAEPRIVLRGLRSITGNNQALVVVDGVAVPSSVINTINPNDVERVDILKGGQAATLFGSDGVNGAIVITTKKGSRRPEFTFSNTMNVESLAYLPKFQTGFGSGSAYGSSNEENFHPSENQQYGPAYDGTIRPLGRQLADGSMLLLPYSAIPNVRRSIWDQGYTRQTDLSYRAQVENSSFFTSYQNVKSNGIVPGDTYERNNLRINASNTYGKLTVGFDGTYAFSKADRTNSDYYFFAINAAGWVPLTDFSDWQNNKFANPSNYYNDYYNNPYWEKDNNRFLVRSNTFLANIKGDYKVNNNLNIVGRVAINQINTTQSVTSNSFQYSAYAKTGAFSNYYYNAYDRFLTGLGRFIARSTPIPGGVSESQNNNQRLTFDLFANHKATAGDFGFKTIIGTQALILKGKTFGVSTSGIGAAGLYNFNNSLSGLFSGSNSLSESRKIGAFIDESIDYKNFLSLHGSYREDVSSLFYSPLAGYDKPNFSTYGVDAAFVLSDLIPSIKNKTFKYVNFIKLRAAYNINGNENIGNYSLTQKYPNAAGYPYSGLLGATVGNTLYNPNLRPEKVISKEVGAEITLFNNKLVLEGTVYQQISKDQVLNVSISAASGYTNYLLNAANVKNNGYELDAKANVYNKNNLSFSVNANYSYNTNKVVELLGSTGLTSFEFQAPDDRASLNATLGQSFPLLRTTALKRDAAGKVIVNKADGWPERTDGRVDQGGTLPKHNLGLGFTVKYKNISFTANAEYRGGALVYHDLGTDMAFTGSGAITAAYNRQPFVWPNSVYLDASGKSIANTNIAVDNYKAIYQGFGDAGFSRGFSGVGEFFVSSADFWKIRDAALNYDFPSSLFSGKTIKGISFSAWGRNLLTFLPKDNWYTDPELSNTSGNSQGINTTLNTPPTRQIGGTLKIVF